MITFPWYATGDIEPARNYIALIGVARLRNITVLPTFTYYGFLIERQLRRSAGMMGYRTAMAPLSLRFYHLSAWAERDALHRFVRTDPHKRAMDSLVGWIGTATFHHWEITGAELPLELSKELFRLDAIPAERPAGI